MTKLSDLKYLFDKRKLLQEFGPGSFNNINEATDAVKVKFKTIFSGSKKEEIFDAIWSNQKLKNDLFDVNITKADAKLDFDDLINDTKSILYNFIKVE
ncbi:hypothetical protein [Paenimyroides aestuarii]|uniref:Uncharacterized protein n=1 Tax=Paenimyroides aestuarii TaxID=2968490 RepID=A0ABY5NPF7_9FLAO|nr:hypothetical protein [Paenimyroides aestuarii]UUV20436.1 hypothetical protein NPX36_08650 [Paenimyroides aestuarii]